LNNRAIDPGPGSPLALFVASAQIIALSNASKATHGRTHFDQGAAFLFLLDIARTEGRINIECIID
jgi:hypothetical protein